MNVIEAAHPATMELRKSVRVNSATSASVGPPAPYAHAMYASRAYPITRDNITAVISSRVAENAVCWCDGWKNRRSFVMETRSERSILSESQAVRQCGADTPVRVFDFPSTTQASPSRFTGISPPSMLCRGRNVHLVRRYQVHIRHFSPEFYLLQARFLRRLGKKCQEILMAQATRQVVQVRSKRYRRPVEPDVIGFASGFVRNLREIKLAPIGLPVAMTKMAYTRGINRRYEDPGPLRAFDCLIQIRIHHVAAAIISVDSIGGHDYLSAVRALRPAFD